MLDQPFINRLRSLMANPPEGSIPMDITPQMAEVMLTYNTANRPLSEVTVRSYAIQMARGDWKQTHQPIVFSDDNHLNDGQHRLAALVLAGATLRMHVSFGEPRECFVVTDTGKKRTAGDVFAINGVTDAALVAAATRLLWNYQAGRQAASTTGQAEAQPTNEQLYNLYQSNPAIHKSTWAGHTSAKSRLVTPSVAVFCHYIAAQKARALADEFFRQVLDGVGIDSVKSPAHKVRAKLIENATSVRKLPPVHVAAYLVLAWNAHHMGRQLTLRWRGEHSPNEAFPRAV